MSLQQDISSMDEINNYQIKDSQKKEYMVERRERKRIERKAKTEIYDKSNLIYKYAFDKNIASGVR